MHLSSPVVNHHPEPELHPVEWCLDVIGCPSDQTLDAQISTRPRRHDDDRNRRHLAEALQPGAKIICIEMRRHPVQQDDVRPGPKSLLDQIVTTAHSRDCATLLPQELDQRRSKLGVRLILQHQYPIDRQATTLHRGCKPPLMLTEMVTFFTVKRIYHPIGRS